MEDNYTNGVIGQAVEATRLTARNEIRDFVLFYEMSGKPMNKRELEVMADRILQIRDDCKRKGDMSVEDYFLITDAWRIFSDHTHGRKYHGV